MGKIALPGPLPTTDAGNNAVSVAGSFYDIVDKTWIQVLPPNSKRVKFLISSPKYDNTGVANVNLLYVYRANSAPVVQTGVKFNRGIEIDPGEIFSEDGYCASNAVWVRGADVVTNTFTIYVEEG